MTNPTSLGLDGLRGYTLIHTNNSYWNHFIIPSEAENSGAPVGWTKLTSPWFPYDGISSYRFTKFFDQLGKQWEGNFHGNVVLRQWRIPAPPSGNREEWQAVLHFPTDNDALLAKLTFNF